MSRWAGDGRRGWGRGRGGDLTDEFLNENGCLTFHSAECGCTCKYYRHKRLHRPMVATGPWFR
ncbi:MAG: hypothetical protein ABGY24_17330, partial [bacterium]